MCAAATPRTKATFLFNIHSTEICPLKEVVINADGDWWIINNKKNLLLVRPGGDDFATIVLSGAAPVGTVRSIGTRNDQTLVLHVLAGAMHVSIYNPSTDMWCDSGVVFTSHPRAARFMAFSRNAYYIGHKDSEGLVPVWSVYALNGDFVRRQFEPAIASRIGHGRDVCVDDDGQCYALYSPNYQTPAKVNTVAHAPCLIMTLLAAVCLRCGRQRNPNALFADENIRFACARDLRSGPYHRSRTHRLHINRARSQQPAYLRNRRERRSIRFQHENWRASYDFFSGCVRFQDVLRDGALAS